MEPLLQCFDICEILVTCLYICGLTQSHFCIINHNLLLNLSIVPESWLILHIFPKYMTVSMLHKTEMIFFWLSLLFTVIWCHNKDEKLEVVGFIEHRDFAGSKIKVSQTFSGIILSSLIYVLFIIGETIHKTYAIANCNVMHALCRITCYDWLQIYRWKD